MKTLDDMFARRAQGLDALSQRLDGQGVRRGERMENLTNRVQAMFAQRDAETARRFGTVGARSPYSTAARRPALGVNQPSFGVSFKTGLRRM